MGTRADFYIGRGTEAEWLGSIAWDGYPSGINAAVLGATTEPDYRAAVDEFLRTRDDASRPEQGWPWPWEDSQTTDYAYAFDDGATWASPFGHGWFNARQPLPDDPPEAKTAVFPNMKERMNIQWGGKRSGLIVVAVRE